MKQRIESDLCPMCSFDYQACEAIVAVAKKHGLVVRGSVIPISKDAYRIRFTASPDRKENAARRVKAAQR